MEGIRAALLRKQWEKQVGVSGSSWSTLKVKGKVKEEEVVKVVPSMSNPEEAIDLAVQLSIHLTLPLAELLLPKSTFPMRQVWCTRLSWTQVMVDHLERCGLSTIQIVELAHSFGRRASLESQATYQAEVDDDTEYGATFAEGRVEERQILHQAAGFFAYFAAKYGPSVSP